MPKELHKKINKLIDYLWYVLWKDVGLSKIGSNKFKSEDSVAI